MSLYAQLPEGLARISPRYGSTLEELVSSLTSEGLTGSAVPLADRTLVLDDGREVRYGDVASFQQKPVAP